MKRVPQTTRQILNTIRQLETLHRTLRTRLKSEDPAETVRLRRVSIEVADLAEELDRIAKKMANRSGSSVEDVKERLKSESAKRRSGQLGASECDKIAKSADLSGCMVALYPPKEVAEAIVVPGGESTQALHITLCFFEDKAADRDDWHLAGAIVAAVVARHPATMGSLTGTGRFRQPDGDEVNYATVSIPGLEDMREELVVELDRAGFIVSKKFAFSPHLTLKYSRKDDPFPDTALKTQSFPFPMVEAHLVQGEKHVGIFPLGLAS